MALRSVDPVLVSFRHTSFAITGGICPRASYLKASFFTATATGMKALSNINIPALSFVWKLVAFAGGGGGRSSGRDYLHNPAPRDGFNMARRVAARFMPLCHESVSVWTVAKLSGRVTVASLWARFKKNHHISTLVKVLPSTCFSQRNPSLLLLPTVYRHSAYFSHVLAYV